MIYVAIPVHDEAQTLGVLLWKLRKVLGEFGRDYEFVLYDDASSDRTPDVIARYRKVLPMTVHRGETRVGYGAALQTILKDIVERSRYPKRDVAVTIQADFTEDPADLVQMVKTIEGGADLVAGAIEEPGILPRNERLARTAARFLLGRSWRKAPVSDPISGFRAYRLIVLKKAMSETPGAALPLGAEGWSANLELLRRAAPHARRIEEVPFRLRFAHRERASRFQAWPRLRDLVRLRGIRWPTPAPAPAPTPATPAA